MKRTNSVGNREPTLSEEPEKQDSVAKSPRVPEDQIKATENGLEACGEVHNDTGTAELQPKYDEFMEQLLSLYNEIKEDKESCQLSDYTDSRISSHGIIRKPIPGLSSDTEDLLGEPEEESPGKNEFFKIRTFDMATGGGVDTGEESPGKNEFFKIRTFDMATGGGVDTGGGKQAGKD